MTDNQDSNLPDKPDSTSAEVAETPAIQGEVLQHLPPEARKVLESVSLQAAFSAQPVFHPILQKITEEHINKVLEQSDKDSERDFKDSTSTRRYNLVYALLAAILFVFVTVYLAGQDKELYRDLLTKIIIFFGGGGLGYGIKAFRNRDD